MCAVELLVAGITVSYTKKINNDLKIKFEITGDELMMLIVYCFLAESTGCCGVCSRYKRHWDYIWNTSQRFESSKPRQSPFMFLHRGIFFFLQQINFPVVRNLVLCYDCFRHSIYLSNIKYIFCTLIKFCTVAIGYTIFIQQ